MQAAAIGGRAAPAAAGALMECGGDGTPCPQQAAAGKPGEAWRACVRDPPQDVSLVAVVLVCFVASLLELRILLLRAWLWPPAHEYRHTAQNPSSSAARKFVGRRIEMCTDEYGHWVLALLIMYLACGELVPIPGVDWLLQYLEALARRGLCLPLEAWAWARGMGQEEWGVCIPVLTLSRAKCGAGLPTLRTLHWLLGWDYHLQGTGQQTGWAKWGLENSPLAMFTGLGPAVFAVYEVVHHCALLYARWLNWQEAKFHTEGGIELAKDRDNDRTSEEVEAADSQEPDYPAAAAAFRRALMFGKTAQLDDEKCENIKIRLMRAEFNATGFGDRVNFSLNSLDDHGKFQLRTLVELDVKDLFPNPYIYENVLPLAKRTVRDTWHYPFVKISLPGSASQQVREELGRSQPGMRSLRTGDSPLNQFVINEIDRNHDGEVDRQEADEYVQAEENLRSQVVKKLRDQLVNVISQDYSSGHVSEDIGSRQLSEEYVFGVGRDTCPAISCPELCLRIGIIKR
jgi:hypothetical protein